MKRFSWLFMLVLVGMQGFFSGSVTSAEAAGVNVAPSQARDIRVAVVIGNSRYPSGALTNPKNDATAVAASLKKLGFDVELKLDASKSDMDAIFKRFSVKAERASVAALFYAGHGIQVGGSNYIVPIDANPKSERDLKREMIRMDDVIDDMGSAKVKLVFFDACRDNPLSRSFSRGGIRGMAAPIEATGTLISFATKHGNTAADGDGEHSPYTSALLAALESPSGVEIEQLLRKVQQGVKQATNGQQEPWRYGSLDGEFYFQAPAPQMDSVKLQQEAIDRAVQEAMKRADSQAAAVEMSYWDSVKGSQNADDYKAYLKRYPRGSFADLAQSRIAALEREAKRQAEDAGKTVRPAASLVGDQTAVELAFWDSIKNSSSVDDFKEYLTSYPQGRFAGLARSRIRNLGVPAQVVAKPVPQAAPAVASPALQAPTQIAMISPAKQAPASVSAFPQPGDSWTYRYSDGWKKSNPQTIVVKVEESEGGRVTDRMSMRGGRGTDERTYEGKPEGAERSLRSDVRIMELLPYVQTLLQEGLKPSQEKDFPEILLGGREYRIKVKLIGQEKVSTPAGSFDAVRVDVIGQASAPLVPDRNGLGTQVGFFSHALWFVPEIRRVVKVKHTSGNQERSPLDDDTLELVSFTRAGQLTDHAVARLAQIPLLKPAAEPISGQPKVGDSWTYRYVDGWKKISPQTITVKVEESESGKVTDKMSLRGGRGVDERTYEGRPEAAERILGGDIRVTELLPYVQIILQEGLQPDQEKGFPEIFLGGHAFRIKARLIGREKVGVPAGTFDALRVNIVGLRTVAPVPDRNGLGTQVDSFSHNVWFAPEVRRVIKVEHKTGNRERSRLDDDMLELVSFSLR